MTFFHVRFIKIYRNIISNYKINISPSIVHIWINTILSVDLFLLFISINSKLIIYNYNFIRNIRNKKIIKNIYLLLLLLLTKI